MSEASRYFLTTDSFGRRCINTLVDSSFDRSNSKLIKTCYFRENPNLKLFSRS